MENVLGKDQANKLENKKSSLGIYRHKVNSFTNKTMTGTKESFGTNLFENNQQKGLRMNDDDGGGGGLIIACCCSFGGSDNIKNR
ncbi:hypothetical protein DY124_07855 [Apilactobacillus micheneri]|uniref:hypothetical protein n=1 Tax=Apilactobacillus micheneri TaxID=1899430 RepID=UPI00112A273E|nr:hypothetical protein [Apilactobacillus micheneri]TPR42307.1 hypothetical protein DY124_07855 [Apilactobacillus micheneri]TPR47007.1 hypothetical protein DY125_07805 [Apilactobacillus micheneri]